MWFYSKFELDYLPYVFYLFWNIFVHIEWNCLLIFTLWSYAISQYCSLQRTSNYFTNTLSKTSCKKIIWRNFYCEILFMEALHFSLMKKYNNTTFNKYQYSFNYSYTRRCSLWKICNIFFRGIPILLYSWKARTVLHDLSLLLITHSPVRAFLDQLSMKF